MRDTHSLHCLLDDDADAVRSASRRRLRSLVISISVQALFITVLVVAPLLATGNLQLQTQWPMPVPIYRGRPAPIEMRAANPGSQASPTQTDRYTPTQLTPPRSVPTHIVDEVEQAPQIGGGGPASVCPNCDPNSPFIAPLDSRTPSGPAPPMPELRPTPIARPVIVRTPIQEAKLIHRVDPLYPPLCKQARLEGTVLLRAIVGRDGTMRELTYVSGPACFVQHSLNAVAQWRYRPTILNGGPVEVETSITVIYKLNR